MAIKRKSLTVPCALALAGIGALLTMRLLSATPVAEPVLSTSEKADMSASFRDAYAPNPATLDEIVAAAKRSQEPLLLTGEADAGNVMGPQYAEVGDTRFELGVKRQIVPVGTPVQVALVVENSGFVRPHLLVELVQADGRGRAQARLHYQSGGEYHGDIATDRLQPGQYHLTADLTYRGQHIALSRTIRIRPQPTLAQQQVTP